MQNFELWWHFGSFLIVNISSGLSLWEKKIIWQYEYSIFLGEKLHSWLFHIQIWNITYYVVRGILQFFKVKMDFRIYQTPFISQGWLVFKLSSSYKISWNLFFFPNCKIMQCFWCLENEFGFYSALYIALINNS